jgi:ribosomal protein L20
MVRCGSKSAAKKTPAATAKASKNAEQAAIAAVQAQFKDNRDKEQARQSLVDARISSAKRGCCISWHQSSTWRGASGYSGWHCEVRSSLPNHL